MARLHIRPGRWFLAASLGMLLLHPARTCATPSARTPAPVPVPDEATRSEAQRLYRLGEVHFRAGRLEEALRAFEDGHRLLPRAEFLLNLAQCHRALGRPREAIAFLRRFVAEAPAHPLRPAAERTLGELERSLPPPVLVAQPRPTTPPLLPPPPPPPPSPPPSRTWVWITLGATAIVGGLVGAVLATRPDDRRALGTVMLPPAM